MKNENILFSIAFMLLLSLFASCDGDPSGPVPSITSFTPDSGFESTEVTIIGENFSEVISENIVAFNGITAEVTSATATELVVKVPPTATTGKISVSVAGSSAISTTDFTVLSDPYTNYRVQNITYDYGEKIDYFYDAFNRVTSSRWYLQDENMVYHLTNEINYSYNASGALTHYINANPNSNQNIKVEFVYAPNGTLQDRKISQAMVSGGIVGPYVLQSTVTFTYQNGLVATSTVKNGFGQTVSENSFVYSLTADGSPKVAGHYVPTVGQPYDVSRIFHKNIKNSEPVTDPHTDPFLMKTYMNTILPNNNHDITFQTEPQGKILTITMVYPHNPSENNVATYTYEPKQ